MMKLYSKRRRWKKFMVMMLSMALLVTSMPAMAFAETESGSVPSEAAQTAEPATSADGREVSAAEETAEGTGGNVTDGSAEIESLREETVKHFLNADGSFTAVNYMRPVHYREERSAEWTEIDNTLSALEVKQDGETVTKYIPQDSPVDVQITDSADSSTLVSLQGEEHRISWSYENLKKAKAEKKPKKEKTKRDKKAETYLSDELADNLTDGLVYADAAEGTDLEIILDGPNLKENLILKDKHAQTQYVIRYDIGSLTAEESDDHTVLLKDGEETVFTIYAPYMRDAAGAYSDAVSLHIFSQSDGILRVILTADKDWIKAKERVYPVIVDPYVAELMKNTNYDGTAFEIIQNDSYPYGTLAAGNDGDYACGDGKFYMKFNLPELKAGDMVTGGELYLYQFDGAYGYDNSGADSLQLNAYRVTESWSASDVINKSYSSAPSMNTKVIDYMTVKEVSTKTLRHFDISRSLKDWYSGTSNYGVCVKANDSSPSAMARFIATDNTTYTGYYHPHITVRYLNNRGLESRWTYHEQDFGESGTGYVNDYTGNLILSVPLAETIGELMPVTLSLVYNGYQSGKNVERGLTCGEGWRLNIQQKVTELKQTNTASSDDDINSLYDSLYKTGYRYVYEDSDGTDHYFRAKEGSTTKFIDEEGLGLTLTEISNDEDTSETWQIEAEDGSRLTFNSKGNLRRVYNSNGQFYKILYSTSVAGAITSITDGAGKKLTLSRNEDNNLSTVKDPAGRETILSYYSGGGLNTVTYPDGTTTAVAHSGGKIIRLLARDDTRIRYTYPDSGDAARRNRVIKIEEFSREASSNCETEYLGQTLTIAYGKNRTSFTPSKGLKQVYQFDNYGRTISVTDSNGAARSFNYLNPSSSDINQRSERSHLVSSTGSMAGFVENQLRNHSLENGTSGWSFSGEASVSTEEHFLGEKSIKLTVNTDAASQKYTPSTATKFTFSAYVKTSSSSVHPKLRANFYDANGTRISYIDSPVRTTKLNWSRMHLTFIVPNEAAYFRVACKMEGEGTAWFDCLQLETGQVMNPYNLVENSDFDEAISGTWTEVNTVTADKRIESDSGAGSYYMTGEGDTDKRLYQKIMINKEAKTLAFSLSGKAEGTSVPLNNDDRRFALQLYSHYTDGTYNTKTISFNPDYTGSQYASGIIKYPASAEAKTVEFIYVRCIYYHNENSTEFDKIQLNLDETGTSYTYDEEGNLLTAADNAGKNQIYTYSSVGEILSAKSADNKNYEYTYSSTNKHRLKTVTSKSSDIRFTFGYNDTGGNESISVQAVDSDDNLTGKYIKQVNDYTDNGNFIATRYNWKGYAENYTWDEVRGLITAVEDTEDNIIDYTYDANDDLLIKAEKDGSSISYSYTTENLLKKISSPSTAISLTYDGFGNILTTAIGSRTLNTNIYGENNGTLKSSIYGNEFAVAYAYDDYDRITKINHNGSEAYKWSYNALGQPGRHEDLINSKTYQYSYDLTGRHLRTDISDGSHIRMAYNDVNLPTELHYSIADGGKRDVYYSYSSRDNLPLTVAFGSSSTKKVTSHYDGLTRKDYTKYVTPSEDVIDVKAVYGYYDRTSHENRTTDIVEHINYVHTNVSGGLAALDRFYVYDDRGYISSEYNGDSSSGTLKERYGYDAKGQLVRHYSARQNKSFVYTYDNAGNITSKKTYPYVTTLAELNEIIDSPQSTVAYTYGDSTWGDLLTKYNGKTVTSDAIGNMTGYDGQSWQWKGRRLEQYTSQAGTATTYKYNADGIRTQKKTESTTTDYFLNGEQILYQKTGNGDNAVEVWFFYDSEGTRVGMYGGGRYLYYLYNVQGDVIALADVETGKIAVSYTYDAWGKCLTEKTASDFSSVKGLNPFKYRGYYWDEESGMYYLNSRYYSPEFGRFISADSQVNGDILGVNLFAYCSNNPVNRTDDQGTFWDFALDLASTVYSAWQVIKNPKDPANWVALGADILCMAVPGVTGGGTIVRASKYADDITGVGTTIKHAGSTANTGWHVGDDISKRTKAGNDPAWSTVQRRYWKNEAYFHPENYAKSDLERMNTGRAPLVEYINGKLYSMELHHINPKRNGGADKYENILPVTPWDHAAIDQYRYFNPK